MIKYSIYMVDGEVLNVQYDEPIDLGRLTNSHWWTVYIPLPAGGSKTTCLNTAHIVRIEGMVIEQ